jgi:hypothetical protein
LALTSTLVHCVTNAPGRQAFQFQFGLVSKCCEDYNLVAGLKKNRVVSFKGVDGVNGFR